jgi:NAD(P)-dependent dehydrogenase (short-subunit alcohol dehydrogenase family)
VAGRLAGKTALLTGATGALGQRFAGALAAEGADLVVTSMTPARLAALVQQLAESGTRVVSIAADMQHRAEAERLADEAWAAFGRIDVIINSARTRGHTKSHGGELLTTPAETWTSFHDLVAWNPLAMTTNLVGRIIDAGTGGSIINVISAAGLYPHPGRDAYGLAKGTLMLMTKYMAREWGVHGIRANALDPGVIITDEENRERVTTESEARGIKNAVGRLGEAEEMLGALIYLASDESTYFTGQIMSVDGGRYA